MSTRFLYNFTYGTDKRGMGCSRIFWFPGSKHIGFNQDAHTCYDLSEQPSISIAFLTACLEAE
jgi:hypothetical protein